MLTLMHWGATRFTSSLPVGTPTIVYQPLELIGGLSADNVIADKAYDAQAIIELIQAQGSDPVIPPKKNWIEQREYDNHLYKERHLVEFFFCKLKEFRWIATRYEKLSVTYLTMVAIASCLIWLR